MVKGKHESVSSLQIYNEVMREAEGQRDDAKHQALEQRPLKLQVRKAVRRKHAKRAERASQTLATRRDITRKSP